MAYSLEYKTWTGEDVVASFEIEDDPLQPGDSDNVICEGIGNLGRYKDESGTLMLKMPASNSQGFEMISYLTIRNRYTNTPYIPRTD